MKTMMDDQYSEYGLMLVKQGQKLHCPHCDQKLVGERTCPICGSKVEYPGERDYVLHNSKLYSVGQSMEHFGSSMQNAGDKMQKTGNSLTWGCTLPILIIIIISLLL